MYNHSTHIPVLLNKLIKELDIQESDFVIDGTAGCGGYDSEIIKLLGKNGILMMIDEDSESILKTREQVQKLFTEVFFLEDNFKNIPNILEKFDLRKPNKIVLDLGWNATQLFSGRGFSFREDVKMLMTYSRNQEKYIFTADNIVNEWDEKNIADILFNYGDEYFSRRIAKAIVEKRKNNRINTAKELGNLIFEVVPCFIRRKKIHPATKTFQALRITVNKELDSLKSILKVIPSIIEKNGRISIITFHSIEDRIVKNTFYEWEKANIGKRYSKKPTKPEKEEVKENPMSRSSKLRTFIIN